MYRQENTRKHFRHHPAVIPNISLVCCGSHPTICSSVGFHPLAYPAVGHKGLKLVFPSFLAKWLSVRLHQGSPGRRVALEKGKTQCISPHVSLLWAVSPAVAACSLWPSSPREALASGLWLYHLFHLSFQPQRWQQLSVAVTTWATSPSPLFPSVLTVSF